MTKLVRFGRVVEGCSWSHWGLVELEDGSRIVVQDDTDEVSAWSVSGPVPSRTIVASEWAKFGFGTSCFPENAGTSRHLRISNEKWTYGETTIFKDVPGEEL